MNVASWIMNELNPTSFLAMMQTAINLASTATVHSLNNIMISIVYICFNDENEILGSGALYYKNYLSLCNEFILSRTISRKKKREL
jgi:hypothetical protein